MAKGNKNGEGCSRRKKRSISYFLLSLLEDKKYTQVQWTDKAKGEFQIHWMHASSGAWVIDNDAETFRLWAKAKGKLKGREDNYKTWKANFRCAMKSRDELEEIDLPASSPYKKKNLKFWRFTDMELVNNYKGEEGFDWNRIRPQSSTRRPTRIMKRRRNRKVADPDETSEAEEDEPSQPSVDHCEQQSSSAPTPSDSVNYETQQQLSGVSDGEMPINMEDNTSLNPYSEGLLRILEEENADTDSVVPNLSFDSYSSNLLPAFQDSQTESQSFHEFNQLPPIHSFITEPHFPDNMLVEQDWELFAGEEKELKGRGATAQLFDITDDDTRKDDDPFFYEGIYTELTRLGSYS